MSMQSMHRRTGELAQPSPSGSGQVQCLRETSSNTWQRGVKRDEESADSHPGLKDSLILGEPKEASQGSWLLWMGRLPRTRTARLRGKHKQNQEPGELVMWPEHGVGGWKPAGPTQENCENKEGS